MYGTYQRALADHGLTVPEAFTNKRRFIRALRDRLKPEVQASPQHRQARKAFYRECLGHLADDYEIMVSFRF